MISIAITGGIGSGKSYISNILQEYGIPIYNTDDEAKRLMVSDEGIRHDLVTLLGEEVYANGQLNKPVLASYLFSSPENASRVNAIIHPRVKEDFKRWLGEQAETEIAAFESAILYEAGFEDTVDAVLMVFAPRELKLERAMNRDKATREQIEARMSAQMEDEEKCRRADFVVYNDGTLPLDEQLTSFINQLKKK